MNWSYRWASLTLVSLFAYSCDSGPESAASKHEVSTLTAIEARYEHTPIAGLEFAAEGEYKFMCIPSNGQRIWIMLNPKTPPYYKQAPGGTYALSDSELKRVIAAGTASSTVIACLASHVVKSGTD